MTREGFEQIGRLHNLLDVVIADGETVLDDDRYYPSACADHQPLSPRGRRLMSPAVCKVGADGAVMACTLGLALAETVSRASRYIFSPAYPRLLAIDCLRTGCVFSGADLLYGSTIQEAVDCAWGLVPDGYPVPHSSFEGPDEYRLFLDEMAGLRDVLAETGL